MASNPRPDAVFASVLALIGGLSGGSTRTPGVSAAAFATYLATGTASVNTSSERYAESLGAAQAECLRQLATDPAARAYVEQLVDALDAILTAASAAPVIDAATSAVGTAVDTASSIADFFS
jgi:hypothetical protein